MQALLHAVNLCDKSFIGAGGKALALRKIDVLSTHNRLTT